MHLWNIKAIAEQLNNDTLSDWEKTRYLIAAFVWPTITGYITNLATSQQGRHGVDLVASSIALAAEVAINIFGLIYLFNLHTKTKPGSFFERIVCLSVPAAIRTFFIGWLALAAFVLLLNTIGGDSIYVSLTHILSEAGPILMVIYFSLLFFSFMKSGFQQFKRPEH
jgi:uncharacterized protein YsxB (DUF464 family)